MTRAEGEAQTKDMATERHYTEAEIAKMWHMHRKTVHKIFDGQPGVLDWVEEGGHTPNALIAIGAFLSRWYCAFSLI